VWRVETWLGEAGTSVPPWAEVAGGGRRYVADFADGQWERMQQMERRLKNKNTWVAYRIE
jgi:hypothetical protein